MDGRRRRQTRRAAVCAFAAAVPLAVPLLVAALGWATPAVLAASPSASPGAAMPSVVDEAVAFTSDEKVRLGDLVATLLSDHDVEAVVATRVASDPGSESEADAAAAALMDRLGIGVGHAGGLVVLFDLDASRCHGQARLFASAVLRSRLPDADRQAIFDDAMLPALGVCRLADAAVAGLERTDRFLSGDRTLPGFDDAAALVAVVLLLALALFVMGALFVLARVTWGRVRALPGARAEYRRRVVGGPRGAAGAGDVPGFWAWWLGVAAGHADAGADRAAGTEDGAGSRTEGAPHGFGGEGAWTAARHGFGGGGAWTDARPTDRGFGGGGFWAGLRDDAGRAVRLGGSSSSGSSGPDSGQGGGGSWSDAGSTGASTGGGGAGGSF